MTVVMSSRTWVFVSVFTMFVMLMMMFTALMLTFAAFLVEGKGAVGADTGEDLLGASEVAGDELFSGADAAMGSEGESADDDVGRHVV